MLRVLPGQRVLVVEDEMLVSWSTQDVLEALGCVVVGPVTSVAQALAAVADEAIDAALLDINLDGEFSYPVADALARRGVPFAFLTGYDPASILGAYRSVPALQKPLRGTELAATLANMITLAAPQRPSAPDHDPA